jgi:hypothetical protein
VEKFSKILLQALKMLTSFFETLNNYNFSYVYKSSLNRISRKNIYMFLCYNIGRYRILFSLPTNKIATYKALYSSYD